MSTAIFYTLPFWGHVNPALPLIKELVHRGERIYVYATEDFRVRIEESGAHFRDYGDYDLEEAAQQDNPLKVMSVYLAPLKALMERCVPEAREIQPDYILHDTSIPWGAFIAEILQVPSVGSQAVLLIKNEMLLSNPSQGVRMLTFFAKAGKEARAIDTLLKTVAASYAIKPKPLLESIHFNGDLTIVYTSRAVQPMQHLFDDNFAFVGPTIEDRDKHLSFPFERLDDRPLIYISMGTLFNKQPDFYRTCLQAFAATPYQVVLSTGYDVQGQELGPLPDNFLVSQYVPQLQILSRTSLFISHAGANSVTESLWFGVPLLLFPLWGDQFWMAQHMAKLGVGKAWNSTHITARRLRALAEEVLTHPHYAQTSKRLAESLHEAGGARKAADAIEDLKRRKHIHQKPDSLVL